MKISFFKVNNNSIDFQSVASLLAQKTDFIAGEEVKVFEDLFANFSETRFCVSSSNGLDAIKIALRSLDLPSDGEVIVPAHTYIASIFAIIQAGLKPILVDVDADTFNIDPSLVTNQITNETKAILPVHLYGHPSDMDNLMAIAKSKNLFIIEDNAQAHGAEYNGKRTGSYGIVNATSFYPSKNLGALGDAGAITTNDEALARKCKLLRNMGSEEKYIHEIIGYNARMDSIQALFLTKKLKYLDTWNNERIAIANRYTENLKSAKSIVLPIVRQHCKHVFHLFVILSEQRDALKNYLDAQGITTLMHYPVPNHLQPALQHLSYARGDFPVAEKIAETCLSLPIYPGLQPSEIDYVCEKILAFEKMIF
ncbi:MAG: DegT/DnrJ/EryC1/StrS family aminotransferase [Chitinophagales bacterium]